MYSDRSHPTFVCRICFSYQVSIREFAPVEDIEYRPQLTSVGHRTIVSGSDARQSMRGKCKQEKTLMQLQITQGQIHKSKLLSLSLIRILPTNIQIYGMYLNEQHLSGSNSSNDSCIEKRLKLSCRFTFWIILSTSTLSVTMRGTASSTMASLTLSGRYTSGTGPTSTMWMSL